MHVVAMGLLCHPPAQTYAVPRNDDYNKKGLNFRPILFDI
jgi:hypothetical protein